MPAWIEFHSCLLTSFVRHPILLAAPLLGQYSLLVLSGLMMAAGVILVLLHRRIAKWPVTEGRIETVNVSTLSMGQGFGSHEDSTAEVSYSYSVAGQFYSGYWTRRFSDVQDAWDFVGPPKGQEVLVHYDPKHPEKSQLAVLVG